LGKNESLYKYLESYHPEILEEDVFAPETQGIVTIPQKAPEGAVTREESVFDLLERIKRFNLEWVRPGHIGGNNTNNVSATVSIKEDEWEAVGEWMWENKDSYNGLSVLPFDNGSYTQAPFEDITKEKYDSIVRNLEEIDLRFVIEDEDSTDLSGELACSGPTGCEVT
jgi:ribonucleoside-diphosphate reductase alpha chain